MSKFRLVLRVINTYNQIAITTIIGEDENPEHFLERCFAIMEQGASDSGIAIYEDAPKGFGYAGGFAEMPNETEFTENGVSRKEVWDSFGWK